MDPAERRVLLMEAAARTFSRLGYRGARMDDVADEAGVAKGLLYQHFPSKEALFRALMEEQGARFTEQLRARWAAAAQGPRGAQPVRLVEEGVAAWLDELTSEDSLLHWIGPHEADLSSVLRDQSLQAIVDQVVGVDPTIDPDLAWLVAAAFQGAVESATTQWRRRGGASREELERLVVAFALNGLEGVRALSRDPAPTT
jgi:AcrR family transcriptional regulator